MQSYPGAVNEALCLVVVFAQASQNGSMPIVTVCEAGGTMKPSVNFPEGKASRSLQAAYRYVWGGGEYAWRKGTTSATLTLAWHWCHRSGINA